MLSWLTNRNTVVVSAFVDYSFVMAVWLLNVLNSGYTFVKVIQPWIVI